MTTPVRVHRTPTRPRADMADPQRGQRRPRVVVVGGGFAGLAAVHGLRGSDADVTLIDRHTYNTFQPLLYQVATATLNAGRDRAGLNPVYAAAQLRHALPDAVGRRRQGH